MSINLIVCMDRCSAIGYKNKLLSHQSADLKRFKQLTQGHFILMGKTTYLSIGKLLPNRHNIILSRNKKFHVPGAFIRHSIEDVIKEYKLNNNEQELYIIGGQEVYMEAIKYANRLYVTIIDHEFDKADTYFPSIDMNEWKVIDIEKHLSDEKNDYDYSFVTYERI
ncbi:dihydrofolate reductase [Niallia sp. FSL W8-0951]|uniref:dihydrofolate reductase n=1 Tax=Niallia sp. FSL W8-0951 TaxID=2954639 RepID=UPI0030F733EE